MTNQDCAEVIRNEAFLFIGLRTFEISTCTEPDCSSCIDGKAEIERLSKLAQKCNDIVHGPAGGTPDDTHETFLNLSDELVSAAVDQLGEEYSPY